MKNYYQKIVPLLCVVGLALVLPSCYGLSLADGGKAYHTTKSPKLDSSKLGQIGVYAFSDGGAVNIRGDRLKANEAGAWLFWVFPFPWTGPVISRMPMSDRWGMRGGDFPDAVTMPFEVETDTVNSGPSLELAVSMQKKLEDFGYESEVAKNVLHRGSITDGYVLNHAQKAGYDQAFVMIYTAIERWQFHGGTSTIGNVKTTNIIFNDGFLYLPSVALIDVQSKEILWSSAHYGLVAHANTANLANQGLSYALNEEIIAAGRDTYIEAASAAVARIFKPTYWKGSYEPFPTLKEQKDGEGEKFDF